jgi:GcrA cell cycle regulator
MDRTSSNVGSLLASNVPTATTPEESSSKFSAKRYSKTSAGASSEATMTIEWTPERTNALMAFWDEGLPTAEIGRRLGVTKNSVVGKVHRLGLPKRGSPIQRDRTNSSRPSAPMQRRSVSPSPSNVVMHKPVQPAPAPQLMEPRPPTKVIKLSALTPEMCSWPIGDPGTDGFRFCGHDSVPSKPYCPEHCAMAYVKVSRDRNKDTQAA